MNISDSLCKHEIKKKNIAFDAYKLIFERKFLPIFFENIHEWFYALSHERRNNDKKIVCRAQLRVTPQTQIFISAEGHLSAILDPNISNLFDFSLHWAFVVDASFFSNNL